MCRRGPRHASRGEAGPSVAPAGGAKLYHHRSTGASEVRLNRLNR